MSLRTDRVSGTGSGSSTRDNLAEELNEITQAILDIEAAGETVALGFDVDISAGVGALGFRAPYAFTLTAVRAGLDDAGSSTTTVDINESGTTVLSTKLTIDASETTSTTAATPAVISDAAIADDAEITIDIDAAGTGAAGLKIWLIGTKP